MSFDFGFGPVSAHRHTNGGGWVADTAIVEATAFVGPEALVYDKARKRQRRAIIEKAIQRRDRRNFNVAPPEITAVPEPFHPAKPSGDPTQSIELNV
jgi:hypothetical protein